MIKYFFILILFIKSAYCEETNIIYEYNISLFGFIILLFITIFILLSNYNLRKRIYKEVLKNLDQQKVILQKNKQAELGNLIANISHQWRDALAIISSINLETQTKLNYDVPITNKDIKEFTQDIEKAVNFMSDTMKVFLEFYKDDSIIESVNIKDCIEKTIDIIDMNIKENKVSINIIEVTPLIINAKKSQCMHIWFSLISNSLNAARKKNIDSIKIDIIINSNEIEYRDNCKGMEEMVLEMVKKNKQNGLGLKIVKDILTKYNWDISYANTSDGVSFKFFEKLD